MGAVKCSFKWSPPTVLYCQIMSFTRNGPRANTESGYLRSCQCAYMRTCALLLSNTAQHSKNNISICIKHAQSGRHTHKTHSYTVMSLRFITQRDDTTHDALLCCAKPFVNTNNLAERCAGARLEENALNTRLANCSRQSLKWLGKSHSSGRQTN